MKWLDIKDKSAAELKELLVEKREELRSLRFDRRSLKHVHKIDLARKTVARVKTLLKQRESQA